MRSCHCLLAIPALACVILGLTSGCYDPDEEIGAAMMSSVTVATDLNGDSRSDLLYRNYITGAISHAYLNGFTAVVSPPVYTEPNLVWKVVADADFNGDAVTDLLWRNTATGEVYMQLFDTNGSSVPGSRAFYMESNSDWKIVNTADIDGDQMADIIWRNIVTGEVYGMLMTGSSIKSQGPVYQETDLAWKIVATGNFFGAGPRNQLLWQNTATGILYLQNVNLTNNNLFPSAVNGSYINTGFAEPNISRRIITAADFDGDGNSDILWRNSATGQVYITLMQGITKMENGQAVNSASARDHRQVYVEADLAWKLVATGDYNGDGKADLLWRNDSTGAVYLILMNGLDISSQGYVLTQSDTNLRLLGPWEYGLLSGIFP